MDDIRPIVSPYTAGEDRNICANTHLSEDRRQNEATVSWILILVVSLSSNT